MKLGIGIGVSASRRIVSAAPSPFTNTYSLDFDGVDEYVDCDGFTLNTDAAWSISLWANLDDFSYSYPELFTLKTDEATGFVCFMGNASSYRGINFGSNLNFTRFKTTGDISGDLVGAWVHIVLTYNGSGKTTEGNYTIYVDGASVANTTTGGFAAAANVSKIGVGSSSAYFDGKIDEFSIWNTALSAADVATLATAPSNLKTALATTPVAWWRMGDSGTYFNSIWELPDQMKLDNYSKYSMEFDGVNDYINLGDSSDFSFGDGATDSAFSISSWVNMADATNFTPIAKDASGGREYVVRLIGDILAFYVIDNSTGGFIGRKYSTALTSLENTWVHIAATYDGSGVEGGVKIYLNGARVDDTNYVSGSYTAMENTSAELRIGSQEIAAIYADGNIDSVSIWSEELTSGNVTSIYASGVPNDVSGLGISGLVAYYRMGESAVWDSGASEWTIPDDSVNSNDGTSSGMTIASRATSAPDNISQANSISMEEADRVTDVPT